MMVQIAIHGLLDPSAKNGLLKLRISTEILNYITATPTLMSQVLLQLMLVNTLALSEPGNKP
jgi:hypothetical protein